MANVDRVNGMLFEGHYYARPGYGNLDSMKTINRADLTDFVSSQFARNVLKVSIAGDISKEDAQKAVEKIFGALPEKADAVSMPEARLTISARASRTCVLNLGSRRRR